MNELEKQLSKLVEKGIEVAEQTGNFVIEQAPDLLQEFYAWHTMKYSFGVLLSITIMLLGRYLPLLWSKKYNEDTPLKWDETKFFNRVGEQLSMWLPFGILFSIGLIVFFINLYNLVFILTAPKLYLIEYFIN